MTTIEINTINYSIDFEQKNYSIENTGNPNSYDIILTQPITNLNLEYNNYDLILDQIINEFIINIISPIEYNIVYDITEKNINLTIETINNTISILTKNYIITFSYVNDFIVPNYVTFDDIFEGDSGSGGTAGIVPAPLSGDANKFLRGDGNWATVGEIGSTDLTISNFTSTVGQSTFSINASANQIIEFSINGLDYTIYSSITPPGSGNVIYDYSSGSYALENGDKIKILWV